jgi:hypothetical protein
MSTLRASKFISWTSPSDLTSGLLHHRASLPGQTKGQKSAAKLVFLGSIVVKTVVATF